MDYFPKILTLETTESCNFSCLHCDVRDHNDVYVNSDVVLSSVEKLMANLQSIFAIHVTGGEPLLSRNFYELWRSLSNYKYLRLFLSTNLSLLDDELLKFFEGIPPTSVNVSLYGFSNDAYTSFTRSKKRDVVYENIIKLKKTLKNTRVMIKIPLVSMVYPDLMDIISFCKEYSLPYGFVSVILPPRSNKELYDSILMEKELLANFILEKYLKLDKNDLTELISDSSSQPGTKCLGCIMNNQLILDTTNRLSACRYHRTQIAVDDFLIDPKIFQKEYEAIVFNHVSNCGSCVASGICRLCPQIIKIFEENNFDYQDYYCWIYKFVATSLKTYLDGNI